MPILELPQLLVDGEEHEYIERMKIEYGNPILLPENKQVLFLQRTDDEWAHFWRGKNNLKPNKFRMHRILWIKFILENQHIRVVKKNLSNNNIVFFCEKLRYVVVCDELRMGDLKCFTSHPRDENFKDKIMDPSLYENYFDNKKRLLN